MDELAASLLSALKRSSAPVETKLSLFNSLKSSIKHQRIPESAQPATIECIRLTIASQTTTSLVNAGFSALGHLIKRLAIQEQTSALFTPRANLLPLLLERVGDVKESTRAAASQALCDLWTINSVEVENLVKDEAIQGSNVRAKETGMAWVANMAATQSLQFRAFVPPMVECLEDADGAVRESAKTNLIELFKDARDAAKADLKRQLIAFNVRRSIASHILSQLQMAPPSETHTTAFAQSTISALLQDHNLGDPTSSERAPPPSAEGPQVEPLYVQSSRELEDIFRLMAPCFDGKEKEENWRDRDTNVLKLRRLLQGNGFTDHSQVFVAGIKGLLDGILKVANSLRTTMSTNGCQMVQELAKTLGPALDPMVEILLQGFDKMSASTKHIAAQNANLTMDTIFSHVTCNARLVQHIWQACQDKNTQPRCFAAGWLRTILKKQVQKDGKERAHFEHSGGLESVDKCIKKCLHDGKPEVRETMRGTYWMFAQTWPERATNIMESLDAKSKQLLEKDPANPNAAKAASGASSFTASVGPSVAINPRVASSSGRLSLKETIAAQKKASLAAKRLPERPSSAMSSFSPERQTAPTTGRPPAPSIQVKARTNPAAEQGISAKPAAPPSNPAPTGLMSAPMRRPRRPDLPRPATADLYANSNVKSYRSETPPRSPVTSPSRLASKTSTANFAAVRPASSMKVHTTAGAERSPRMTSPRVASPRNSPVKLRSQTANIAEGAAPPPATRVDNGISSPSGKDENLTMIIPNGMSVGNFMLPLPQRNLNNGEQTVIGRLSLPSMAEEDFTLIILQKPSSPKLKPSENMQAEVLPPFEGQTSDTQQMSACLETIIQQNQTVAIDVGMEVPICPITTTSTEDINSDDLIVFEDPIIADIPAPTNVEPRRAALEELPVNEQQQQILLQQNINAPSDKRPASPSKNIHPVPMESPYEDRAEVLKARRLFGSGIERIRAKTLDAHGFRRLLELVRTNAKSKDIPFTELLGALIDYLDSSRDATEAASIRAIIFRTQALACIRAVVALPLHDDVAGRRYPDALCSVILESGSYEKASLFGNDLEKTVDEIVKHANEQLVSCLEAVIGKDWSLHSADPFTRRRIISTALSTTTKLMAAMRAKDEGLNSEQRRLLGVLAVQYLGDVDADVRKADTEFCLEVHSAFGQEHTAEFWKAMKKVGEAQLNLIVYYLAKRGMATV